ncbi:hypothetical protein Misp01_48800 [Microtetraspora sp. NBRC 13810]|uniref:peptidase inhibitor family I36 protein n=1 Tax=Microtetraspora sp. NBRC 13810 TaxID=3030990 RepID=UPI0024A58410|nr:peptidase inhibitor family I36 protein [Microtetraspora sp. NBRC 13810]GLW09751.1 hypothetical protein Misp01_48800 [Microtetraspora sp. NBRC 13810]
MSSTHRGRIATAMIAIALSGAVAAPAQAVTGDSAEQAALKRAAAACGSGEICLWRDRNYSGTPWRWTPGSGYRDMPSYLHDHVYSFYANARGCFIDWNPQEKRPVNPGDYAKAYDTNFGRRIDAIAPNC